LNLDALWILAFAHVLFGKPVPTFPGHAPVLKAIQVMLPKANGRDIPATLNASLSCFDQPLR
jgi:hypothetical protein